MNLEVWKLGGSLLDFAELPNRWQKLQAEQTSDQPVAVIIGGGVVADVVRSWDQTYDLPTEVAHRLAIEGMRLTARLAAHRLGLPLREVDPSDDISLLASKTTSANIQVWDISSYWLAHETHLDRQFGGFTQDWSLTSDAMTAILAAYWDAQRLLLIKSIAVDPSGKPCDWAAQGHVDAVFPTVADHIAQIDWVNLRSDTYR